MPYQTNKLLRNLINSGEISYSDLHLSESAQLLRYGFYGKLDVAIVEACAITEEGNIIPTTSMGNTASFVQQADMVIVEVNTSQPLELEVCMTFMCLLIHHIVFQFLLLRLTTVLVHLTYLALQIKLNALFLVILQIKLVHLAKLVKLITKCLNISLNFFKMKLKKGHMPKKSLTITIWCR